MLGSRRSGRSADSTPPLELGVGIGVCIVPSVFVVVAWWFGWRAGVAMALAVAAAIALVCWVVCHRPRDRVGRA